MSPNLNLTSTLMTSEETAPENERTHLNDFVWEGLWFSGIWSDWPLLVTTSLTYPPKCDL